MLGFIQRAAQERVEREYMVNPINLERHKALQTDLKYVVLLHKVKTLSLSQHCNQQTESM